ncbi:MAG: hypothetical protein IIX17_00065, partial [Tidjanibacter sp.]|nr:hypothetical protein [Tidjanibacter sp.]
NADTVYMRSDSIFIYTVDSLGYFKLNRPDSTALAEIDNIVQEAAEEEILMPETSVAPAAEGEDGEAAEEATESAEDAGLAEDAVMDAGLAEDAVMDAGLAEDAVMDAGLAEEAIAEIEQTDELAEESAVPEEIDDGEEGAEMGVSEEATTEEISENETPEERTDRVIVAFPHVKMYSVDAQVVCDSLIAFTVDSTAQLHIDPIMWNEQNQINSKRVDVYTKDQKIERAVFTGEPFPMMVAEVDTTRYNQVTGKTIENYFRDGKMYKADIVGNAQTYYYVVDDKDGAVQGFLVAECADITFNIKDNTVETIVWRQNPEYTIYPITKIPATQPQFFDHYSWNPELRPTLEDVFDRTINESVRAEYEAMEKPKFPITKSINTFRELMTERGSWVDREDEITDRAREFISTREPYDE